MSVIPSPLDNDGCDIAIRASFLHFLDDPANGADALEYLEDGLLIIRQGRVKQLVDARDWIDHLPDGSALYDYSGCLVMPGFIDTHTHYPQTEMIASHGLQLLDWLEQYTFPTESKFAEREYSDRIAEFFCEQMLQNGTTTSAVFATVHEESVDAIFSAAERRSMCLVAGKVMMDRNAPSALLDDTQASYWQSEALLKRWHCKGRLHYAVTPRFAPCCSPAQLELCGQLLAEHEGLYLQSHVAENVDEVNWVAKLFPESRSYLDVYDRFGLLGPRAVYAHCIHLDDVDRERMAASGAAMAFCPTSNLFLGSGLFSLDAATRHGIRVGLATDVGAGTSFSQLQTLAEAYKVCQLSGYSLSPLKAFHLATLGAAESLYLDDRIGNFAAGKEADFVVFDLEATDLLALRLRHSESIEDKLFALMMLGDDRCVQATHVLGQRLYQRGQP